MIIITRDFAYAMGGEIAFLKVIISHPFAGETDEFVSFVATLITLASVARFLYKIKMGNVTDLAEASFLLTYSYRDNTRLSRPELQTQFRHASQKSSPSFSQQKLEKEKRALVP